MRQLNARNQKLWCAIDEVLFYVWDPIGTSETPEARNEYETYAQDIFVMLTGKKCTEARLAEYLIAVQTDNMGIEADEAKCRDVASLLMQWKEYLWMPQ